MFVAQNRYSCSYFHVWCKSWACWFYTYFFTKGIFHKWYILISVMYAFDNLSVHFAVWYLQRLLKFETVRRSMTLFGFYRKELSHKPSEERRRSKRDNNLSGDEGDYDRKRGSEKRSFKYIVAIFNHLFHSHAYFMRFSIHSLIINSTYNTFD